MLGGIFGATLVGAVSYQRAARRLARALPVAPIPLRPGMPAPATEFQGELPLRATEVLTKREIVHLFVVPGIFASVLAATLGGVSRWALDVDTMDDLVRQVRWLCASGPRPQRVAGTTALGASMDTTSTKRDNGSPV